MAVSALKLFQNPETLQSYIQLNSLTGDTSQYNVTQDQFGKLSQYISPEKSYSPSLYLKGDLPSLDFVKEQVTSQNNPYGTIDWSKAMTDPAYSGTALQNAAKYYNLFQNANFGIASATPTSTPDFTYVTTPVAPTSKTALGQNLATQNLALTQGQPVQPQTQQNLQTFNPPLTQLSPADQAKQQAGIPQPQQGQFSTAIIGPQAQTQTTQPPEGATLISGPSGLQGLTESQIWRDPNSNKIYRLPTSNFQQAITSSFDPSTHNTYADGSVIDRTSGEVVQSNDGGTSIADQLKNLMQQYGISLPDPNKNPMTEFSNAYKELYNQFGLSDIKSNFEKVQKEYQGLQNELNDKIIDANMNPWISEGLRSKTVASLQEKYSGKLGILTSKLQLYQGMYDRGVQEANFVAQQGITLTHNNQVLAQDTMFKLVNIAQQEEEAKRKMQEMIIGENKEKQKQLTDLMMEVVKAGGDPRIIDPKASLSTNLTNAAPFLQGKPELMHVSDSTGQYAIGVNAQTGHPMFVTRVGEAQPQGSVYQVITAFNPATGKNELRAFDTRTNTFAPLGVNLPFGSVDQNGNPLPQQLSQQFGMGTRADRNNNPAAIAMSSNKSQWFTNAGIQFTRGDPFPDNPNMFTYRFSSIQDGIKAANVLWSSNGNKPIGSVLSSWSKTQAASNAGIDPRKTWNSLTSDERTRLLAAQYKIEGSTIDTGIKFAGGRTPIAQAFEPAVKSQQGKVDITVATNAIVDAIARASKAVNKLKGPAAVLAGEYKDLLSKVGYFNNVQSLNDLRAGGVALLLKSLGIRISGDAFTAIQRLVPKPTDDKRLALSKIEQLRNLLPSFINLSSTQQPEATVAADNLY